jgi:hypothetical protein
LSNLLRRQQRREADAEHGLKQFADHGDSSLY